MTRTAPAVVRPVRKRTIALPDGALRVDRLVPCRASGGSSPLAECASCARRVVSEDPGAIDGDVVTCRAEMRVDGTFAPEASAAPRVPMDVVELALRTPVGEVVSRDVVAVSEAASVAVARAASRGSALVVVDAEARPLGLVDASQLHDVALDPASRVGDLARPLAGSVHDETSLVHAIAGLVGEGDVGGVLPVVDDDGALIALLSPLDVVRWLAARAGY